MKCPYCDGSGAIPVEVEAFEAGCCNQPLENGECCGNAVPVPVYRMELEQCQWCAENPVTNPIPRSE